MSGKKIFKNNFYWEKIFFEKKFFVGKRYCQEKMLLGKIFFGKEILDKRQKVQESDEIDQNMANKVTN